MTVVVGGQQAGYLTWGLRIVLVATAYYFAARIGLQLALVRGQVTPLWPPTGIGLACLLVLGLRAWPGIALGAFVVNASIGPSLPATLAITAGNTLALVCACVLLTRVGFRLELDRIRDVLALVLLAALAAMTISATVGAASLDLAGELPLHGFWPTWAVWLAGDALGVLVVTPVLLVACPTRWRWPTSRLRWLEAGALMLGTLGASMVVTSPHAHLLFQGLPFVIWAALRFQLRGAGPVALLVSSGAVLAAVHGTGPFDGLNLLMKMMMLLGFITCVALTALLLAAITTQRDEALRAVERAVAQLSEAMAALEPYSLLRDGLLNNVLRERTTTD